ncbi:MAG: ArsR/SmtB family transcription factor, partial [bacterium]
MDKRIYELHADVCKTLSNAKRLEILNALRENEMTVTELTERVGALKANISQHLAVMRQNGIL